MISFSDFVTQEIGKNDVGDTQANDGECVGLVEVWLDNLGSPHIWGNACDLPVNADRNAYNIIPNSPDLVPGVGDIGVLPAGWGGSAVGHCFIVAPGTTVETLVVLEQNDRIGGGNGAVRLFEGIGWPEGLTFIHPYALDVPAPSPVIPETPVVDPAPLPQLPAESLPSPEPVVADSPSPVVDTPQTDDQSAGSSTSVPVPVTVQKIPLIPPVSNATTPSVSMSSSKVSNESTNIKEDISMFSKISLHEITIILLYVGTIASAVGGYFDSTQTATLLGVLSAGYAAVQHAHISTPVD